MMGGIVVDLCGRSSLAGLYACGEVSRTGVHGANRLASNSLLEGLRGAAQVAADEIRSVMWEFAGIDRSAQGLRTAVGRVAEIEKRLPVGATEETNMAQTARLIAEAALLRRESRGGHYRSDFPRAKGKWRGRHIEW
jgi:L-aspartate oxidase